MRRPLLTSLLLFLLFACVGLAIVWQGAAFALEQQRSRSLSATYALASVVRQHGRVDDFEALAAEMLPIYGGLSSLQLAAGGVVTQVYPLAGNETVLGHNLLDDPDRRLQARAALESRQLTVAGPFRLRQGGIGVVGRLAVFVPDAGAPGQERPFPPASPPCFPAASAALIQNGVAVQAEL